MADHYQSIRLQRVEEPKIRLRVMPRVPPLEIELQNTGTEIQWRVGTTGDWATLIDISDLDASISIGTVTTLPAGDTATVTNSGTAQDVILDFGIPAGEDGVDGVMASVVAGLGISVNSADPANPVVTAAVQSVAALTGAITAAALKTALAIAVADITDASANGRSLISAANYAAMKTLLAIAQADVTGLTTASSPQFTAVEIGNATDTTLSRGAAGFIAVEGKRVPSPASQASGDILYRGTTEWERLAKGTAGQALVMNAGATAPEWGASGSGQPIPTSSTFAVGTHIFVRNNAGGSIADGGTIAGSSLQTAYANSGGALVTGGGAQTGTWTNRSGRIIASSEFGYFARTA